MKLKLFITVMVLFFSLPTFGETKIGLGTNVSSWIVFNESSVLASSGFIHLPIRINNKVMLEPYIIYSEYDEEGNAFTVSDSQSRGLGFGAFYMASMRDSINGYVGGRLSWYESERTTHFQDGDEDKDEYESWAIAPLVGLEYQVHDYVFLAIEAGIGYTDSENKETFRFSEPDDSDEEGVRTFSNIMLRVMF